MDFCTVVKMTANEALLIFVRIKSSLMSNGRAWQYQGLGEGWGYLCLCAAVGIAFLGAALVLYRRRKLECAGSFMAVRGLEPVFAVVFALCTGCVFAVVGEVFEGEYLVFLIVGLVIGWFVGQMLLRRTVKVFQWKTFAKLGILGLALGASLLLAYLDPLGITRWVPAPEKVAQVEIDFGREIYTNSTNYVLIENPEEIQELVDAHQQIVADGPEAGTGRFRSIAIRYQLKDGRQVNRSYTIYEDSKAWEMLRYVYDSPKAVLGYTDRESFMNAVTEIQIQGYTVAELCTINAQKYGKHFNASAVERALAQAIWADAEANNLPKEFMKEKHQGELAIRYQADKYGFYDRKYILYYAESENVLAWIAQYAKGIIPT
jgi:hypothetical protein